MAEASSLHGSERNGAICASCDEKTIASGFCMECLEYLCETCLSYHKRSKASRDHRVLTGGDIPESDAVFQEIFTMTQCTVHQHRTLAFVCMNHKMHLCVHCVAERHRTCETISIDKVSESKDIQHILNQSVSLLTQIGKSKQQQMTLMTDLKQKEESLQDERKVLFEKELKKLKKRNTEVLKDIKNMFCGIIETHRQALDKCEEVERKTAKVREIANIAAKYYDQDKTKQALIGEKLSTTLADKSLLLQDQDITCDNNESLMTLELKGNAFIPLSREDADEMRLADAYEGSFVSAQTESSSDEVPENEIESTESAKKECKTLEGQKTQMKEKPSQVVKVIRISSDKGKCKPVKCLLTLNESYIIVDSNNRTLKLFDAEFNLVNSCGLQNAPVGACIINTEKLALVYASKTNVDTVGLKPRAFHEVACAFRVDGPTLSIASIGNKKIGVMVMKWLLMEGKRVSVEVRTISGDLLLDIPIIRNGNIELRLGISNPLVLTSVNDDFLVGSNLKLSRLDERGKLTWFYHGDLFHQLQQVTDASVHGNNVYICGNVSRNVHRVSESNYKDMKVVLNELKAPRCLCINPEKKQLIIGFDDTDSVEIYPI